MEDMKLEKPIIVTHTITDVETHVSFDDESEEAQVTLKLMNDDGFVVATEMGIIRNGKSDRLTIRIPEQDQRLQDSLIREPGALEMTTGYDDLLKAFASGKTKEERADAVHEAVKTAGGIVDAVTDIAQAVLSLKR